MNEVPGPHREHNPPQMATVGQVSNDSQKWDFLHTANMVSLPACLVSRLDPHRDVRVALSEPMVCMCNRGDTTLPLYNLGFYNL